MRFFLLARKICPFSGLDLISKFTGSWLNRSVTCLAFVLYGSVCNFAFAIDEFDRHDLAVLQQVTDSGEKLKEFAPATAVKLQPLSPDIESTCLVVETNDGNLAKMLVSFGFRKQRGAEKPIPVVMLDRFVTYERGKNGSTVANGVNVMLFPGFEFDLDLGQAVPAGFDADLQLTEKGGLKAVGPVTLYGVNGSQLPPTETTPAGKTDPSIIAPEDFTGVWQVDGDGRWIGEWDLTVNEEGQATGKFLSAETQASYPISGQVGGATNQIKLQIDFNNATQIVEAYLWTKDKSKLAGSFSLSGRKFGLMATRQPAKR